MKKIVLIPDSFKGTLTAAAVCGILSEAARRIFPDAEVVQIPVADGGEGTAECFRIALGGTVIPVEVSGPWGERIQSSYTRLPDGTAVVEMASCAGLPLVGERRDPGRTTTYGVGELLVRAAEDGACRIVLGLGGSATNDAGAGAAAAAGIRFLDAQGEPFVPVGMTLSRVRTIDTTGIHPLLARIPLTVMCDVTSPLSGMQGAAHVFAPQKGADAAAVLELDRQLWHIGALYDRIAGHPVSEFPGAGAAGGMGCGMMALLSGVLTPGIDTVLDTVHAEAIFADADLIVTGEGCFDSQSMRGKVVAGVARRAGGKPVVVIAGGCERDLTEAYEHGVTAVFSINTMPKPLSESRGESAENLLFTAENVFRLWCGK